MPKKLGLVANGIRHAALYFCSSTRVVVICVLFCAIYRASGWSVDLLTYWLVDLWCFWWFFFVLLCLRAFVLSCFRVVMLPAVKRLVLLLFALNETKTLECNKSNTKYTYTSCILHAGRGTGTKEHWPPQAPTVCAKSWEGSAPRTSPRENSAASFRRSSDSTQSERIYTCIYSYIYILIYVIDICIMISVYWYLYIDICILICRWMDVQIYIYIYIHIYIRFMCLCEKKGSVFDRQTCVGGSVPSMKVNPTSKCMVNIKYASLGVFWLHSGTAVYSRETVLYTGEQGAKEDLTTAVACAQMAGWCDMYYCCNNKSYAG